MCMVAGYIITLYDKMPIVYGFSTACVTFQFSFFPIREGQFEK